MDVFGNGVDSIHCHHYLCKLLPIKPLSAARFRQSSKAFLILEHFPTLFFISPSSPNVMEQCRNAHTAAISDFDDDNAFDFEGEETQGLEVRPN
mmetsp:Transcript_20926/g.34540  ORF Transcript_20926/g.34540 Transcript_20926/m.34540 type:complete len:94 (+) Transcript_20926:102-383(+)